MDARLRRSAALDVLLAFVALVALHPGAGAGREPVALPGRVAGRLVGELGRTVLELPADDENPDVRPRCVRLDRVVATPGTTSPTGTDLRCRLRVGQRVLVVGRVSWRSAYEQVASGDLDTSEAGLRAAALGLLDRQGPPEVRLDGRPVAPTRGASRLVHVDLPRDNLLGGASPSATTLVVTGWVAVVVPTAGRHTVTVVQPDGTSSTARLSVLRRSRHPVAAAPPLP